MFNTFFPVTFHFIAHLFYGLELHSFFFFLGSIIALMPAQHFMVTAALEISLIER